jgi:hypothetical protein
MSWQRGHAEVQRLIADGELEQVCGEPDLLARIESVLDDPSLAVPLDDTASSPGTAADGTGTPSAQPMP